MAALWLALVGGVVLHSLYLHFRGEPRVAGSHWALGLRLGALFVLLVLALDPLWPPWRVGTSSPSLPLVILDATEGQWLPRNSGETGWEAVLRVRSQEALGGLPVARLEARGLVFPEGGPQGWTPPAPGPRPSLEAALRDAAEAGYGPLLLLSDLRWEDPEGILHRMRDDGVGVQPFAVAGWVRNAGIRAFRLPTPVISGAASTARVTVHHEGLAEAPSEVRVELLRGGEVWLSREVRIDGPVGVLELEFELPPAPTEPGWERLEARVRLDGDGYPGDDRAVAYRRVERREGGVVALSFRPGWELSHLLPTLADLSGLPGRGWIRAGPELWLPFRRGGEAEVAPASRQELEEWVASARILVVQGLDGPPPEWLADSWDAPAARLFLEPGAGAEWTGFSPGAPSRGGEWEVVTPPPPSPLAPLLAFEDFRGLPPLRGVPLAGEGEPTGSWVPVLEARSGGDPRPHPVLLIREVPEGRRDALLLGEGLWRWSARDGSPRERYRAAISALAGWLAEGRLTPVAGEVVPVDRVGSPHHPLAWAAPGRAGKALTLEGEQWPPGSDEGPGVPWQRTVVVDEGEAASRDGFQLAGLEPGRYSYRVVAGAGEDVGAGVFDVEHDRELLMHPPRILPQVGGDLLDGRPAATAAVPLRERPWAYLLVMALLCGEWWMRRRSGLR